MRSNQSCGEGGIRTLDTPKGIPVFETGRFNHSRTSPINYLMIPFALSQLYPSIDLKNFSLVAASFLVSYSSE